MSVNTELKHAAEAVIAMNYPWEHTVRDGRLGKTSTEYARLAHPVNVLSLIAENDRLSGECEGCPMQVAEELRIQVDQLKAENAGLRTGYQAYERVNAELKAENKRLHKVASELRRWTSCNHLHHEPHEQHADDVHCKVLERIDAALGKGE